MPLCLQLQQISESHTGYSLTHLHECGKLAVTSITELN